MKQDDSCPREPELTDSALPAPLLGDISDRWIWFD